ncbi:MFS transporter [Bacillus sp. FJAT-29790]|uniref:MFS transporter n=1 Tax=Bacillus sp. FJAT-29790 TaxID=1895002 RepID=UPI001C215A98|nr:MFS transporter [Bacillus sp. FJAT-29790]MBU8881335.1 MFS transporter [Bacillus sp. FJAT-29790]
MNQAEIFIEKKTIRKVTWRIIPFVFICYIISYIDRANLGYAALEMNADLALSSKVFGFASGIFFIGYFLFEVPSNVMMQRFGARVWIARILITWGILAVATGFVQNAMHLYILRFLLGVAEAGFFPGIILYFTYWFRSKEQATTIGLFTAAIPVSYIIGAPLSTWIMDYIHWMDFAGWRWMFILEGLPAVVLGIITLFYLTERPENAKWLNTKEKEWLVGELKKERESRKNVKQLGILKAITNPKVLFLSFIYFVYQTGSLGVGYWMPQIIKGFSGVTTNMQIGLIAMIPYIGATIGMLYWSRRSDSKGERRLHSAIPLFIAAIGLVGAGLTSNPYMAIALITVSLTGMYSFKAPFWALPSLFLTQSTAAIAIASINSIGNLGGFVGPYTIGLIKDGTGDAKIGLFFLSALLLISFLMVFFMKTNEIKVEKKAQVHAAAEKQV